MSAARRRGLAAAALLVLLAVAVVVIYEGLYNIAADVPHTRPVYWLLEGTLSHSPGARYHRSLAHLPLSRGTNNAG
jgi:hypothetical protein